MHLWCGMKILTSTDVTKDQIKLIRADAIELDEMK
jgi:hypothetical protein